MSLKRILTERWAETNDVVFTRIELASTVAGSANETQRTLEKEHLFLSKRSQREKDI